jgi:hypothetical protein
MTVTADILATWRHPREVMRAKLAGTPREDRALATLIGGCVLIFIAELPGLARAAHLDPSVPLDARIGGALLATLFLLPLIFYALAGISHLVMRLLRRAGSPYGARVALFWSVLSVGPWMLVQGLVAGLAGPGWLSSLTGFGVLVGFVAIWRAGLAEVREMGTENV